MQYTLKSWFGWCCFVLAVFNTVVGTSAYVNNVITGKLITWSFSNQIVMFLLIGLFYHLWWDNSIRAGTLLKAERIVTTMKRRRGFPVGGDGKYSCEKEQIEE